METKTPGSMVGAYVLSPAPFKGAVVVVYLRPLGRFLFVGHWPGYDSSIVSGEWSVAEQVIILNGEGSVHADIGHTASQQFKGVFQIQEGSDGAALVGVEGKDSRNGWSLLSWKGHFVFRVGSGNSGRVIPEILARLSAP